MIDQEPLSRYLERLASKAATPGGGAAAGLCGAQACALVAMVCRLTRDNGRIARILELAEKGRARFVALADEDMRTFERVMAAYRLPAARRHTSLQPALKAAAEVPLAMIDEATAMIECITELAQIGNPNVVTDTGIASLLTEATIKASRLNVLVNLRSIDDASFVAAAQRRLAAALAHAPALSGANATVDVALSREEPPPSSPAD